MAVIPTKHSDRIAFFANHIATWTAEATNIGTTSAAVTDLQSKVTAATTKLAAQQVAQSAAKSATLDVDLAIDTMTNAGMAIIEQIRTKARSAGEGVYVLADIPAPATPTSKPPPGKAEKFVVTLNDDGSFDLGWKCPNPPGTSGTIYQIWRRTGSTGEFTYLAGTGTKRFTDTTIPAGVGEVTYKIQAVRSTAVGPWATFLVIFGTAATGSLTASVTETTPKLAA